MIFGAETENKRKKLQLKKSFTKKIFFETKIVLFLSGEAPRKRVECSFVRIWRAPKKLK